MKRLVYLLALIIITACSNNQALPTVAAFPTGITPSATITQTPTPDPTAEALSLNNQLWQITEDTVVGDVINAELNSLTPAVLITFKMSENFSGYAIDYTGREMVELACAIRNSGIVADGTTYQFTAQIKTIDNFGNEGIAPGVDVRLMPDSIEQINCENALSVNIEAIAQLYRVSPLLTD